MEKFRLLLLGNSSPYAEQIISTMEGLGMVTVNKMIHSEMDLMKSLKEQKIDAIIGGTSNLQFNSLDALRSINKHGCSIPFIVIAAITSDNYLVKLMKEGVTDCVLPDQLASIPGILKDAIGKQYPDTEKKVGKIQANESLLKEAASLAHFGCWESDLVKQTEYWSDELYKMLGFEPGEIQPTSENLLRRMHPEDVMLLTKIIGDSLVLNGGQKADCRIISKGGVVKYMTIETILKRDENGKPLRLIGSLHDVSEARSAELNEKKINADLVQRNTDLEQFAYIISHNLRAPVANIVGVSNTLLEGNLEANEVRDFMEALSVSVKKLDNIITDLNHILQVKRHVNENMEMVSFSQLLDDIKSSIGIFLEDECIMLLSDFSEVEEMWTLKSYMRSIFYNLISNSIKYRKPQLAPVIEIKSRKYKDKIELTFKDNSIGIDLKNNSDQIFGLYKRFNPGYAEGKGMGLFMVKTQVETLGGKISVQSKVNEGAEFKIELKIKNIAN